MNPVSRVEGGGVTAGSMVSVPRDFLVKLFVAIEVPRLKPFIRRVMSS
jgi:hypothetical protein